MSDYISVYTGQQVDRAVGIALNLNNTLDSYVKTSDINYTVAGLDSSRKVPIDFLPVATSTVKGIVQAGPGLTIDNGTIAIDSDRYYNKADTDALLSNLKTDIVIPTKLSDFENDIISVTSLGEDNYRIEFK
jgi:hypothetical protein